MHDLGLFITTYAKKVIAARLQNMWLKDRLVQVEM